MEVSESEEFPFSKCEIDNNAKGNCRPASTKEKKYRIFYRIKFIIIQDFYRIKLA